MANELADRFRRWFEYEQDAHAKVLASFDTVPPDRRDGREFKKAVALLGHVVAARRVWLFRFGILPTAGALFLDDRQQQVAHLQPRRAPLGVLALVHAPVGERERGARGLRLVREQREPV